MSASLQIFDKSLFKNSRFYLLIVGLISSLIIYITVPQRVGDAHLSQIRLEEIYGFLSLGFIYLALLATPLTSAFKSWSINPAYLHLRRALGVLGFYFAALHMLIALFGTLGGLDGLTHLTTSYLTSVILGFIGLFILLLMAVTSFDYAIERLTFPRWKFLHRFVYLASLAIIIHIVLISAHINGFLAPATQCLIIAGILLGILEAVRLDTKHPNQSLSIGSVGAFSWGFSLITVLFLLSIVTANIQPASNVPAVEHNHEGHL